MVLNVVLTTVGQAGQGEPNMLIAKVYEQCAEELLV